MCGTNPFKLEYKHNDGKEEREHNANRCKQKWIDGDHVAAELYRASWHFQLAYYLQGQTAQDNAHTLSAGSFTVLIG
jgi:hypothetical protein